MISSKVQGVTFMRKKKSSRTPVKKKLGWWDRVVEYVESILRKLN